jgi:hypothetical protein
MIRSQWVSFLFLLSFAISLAHTIAPHSHGNDKSAHSHSSLHHKHEGKNSHSHSSSKLPVVAHFSNSDFIGSEQVNFSATENSVEDGLLPALSFLHPFLHLASCKLSIPFFKEGKPPSGPLLAVLSLRAPPVTLE